MTVSLLAATILLLNFFLKFSAAAVVLKVISAVRCSLSNSKFCNINPSLSLHCFTLILILSLSCPYSILILKLRGNTKNVKMNNGVTLWNVICKQYHTFTIVIFLQWIHLVKPFFTYTLTSFFYICTYYIHFQYYDTCHTVHLCQRHNMAQI